MSTYNVSGARLGGPCLLLRLLPTTCGSFENARYRREDAALQKRAEFK